MNGELFMKPIFSLVMYCLLVTLVLAGVHADSADDFLNTGNTLLYKNNDYSGALDAYEQGIQLNSTNTALWNGKAYVLQKLNRYTEALDAVNKALELNPKNPQALNTKKSISDHLGKETFFKNGSDSLFNQGSDLLTKKDYSGALKIFTQDTQENPESADAWTGKGYVLSTLDKDSEAIDALNKALELDPDNSFAKETIENLVKHLDDKGNALIKSNNFSGAMEIINLAIQANPKDVVALNNKAYILENTDKYDEALEVINQALEVNPQFSSGWLTKGYILSGLGKTEEALNAFNETLKLNPDNKNAKWGIDNIHKNQTYR